MYACGIKERFTNATLFTLTLDVLHNTSMRFCREIAFYTRIKVILKIPNIHFILNTLI